jgi:hypothetical protein
MTYFLRALAVAAVLVLAVAVAACGSGSPSVTIHGQVLPARADGVPATSYGFCSEGSPSPGDQVTVSDPGGKVIGIATLGTWNHTRATVDGVTVYPCLMPFTMKGVPGEQRYGFGINNVPGKIWVTKVNQLVTLDVSSSG